MIQSQCYLYGIGAAVQGTPADDPAIVAAIRAGQDIEKHLASPSAQYRYEAVKKSTNAEVLKRLLLDDPYEEIRAAAVLALNAADPNARAGRDHLLADYALNFWTDPPPREGWAYHTNRDRTERRHWHQLTLRALGEQGRVLLERVYPEMAKSPVPLRIALDIATTRQWRIGTLVKDGLEVAQRGPLAKTAPWQRQVPVNTENAKVLPGYFAASDAATDPAAAEILLKAYPNTWELYPTFARNLPLERLLAWLEPIALESAHPVHRGRILTAWRAIGPAALPSMERVKRAMVVKAATDKLAGEYAKAIEETITALKKK